MPVCTRPISCYLVAAWCVSESRPRLLVAVSGSVVSLTAGFDSLRVVVVFTWAPVAAAAAATGIWLGKPPCISLNSLHASRDKKHLLDELMKYML